MDAGAPTAKAEFARYIGFQLHNTQAGNRRSSWDHLFKSVTWRVGQEPMHQTTTKLVEHVRERQRQSLLAPLSLGVEYLVARAKMVMVMVSAM